MPTNDFLPFAAASGANVIAQSAYLDLVAREAGFVAGTALSPNINKVWRQSSIMAAVMGQYICDLSGEDAIDDGNVVTLLANFKASIASQIAEQILPAGIGAVWLGPVANIQPGWAAVPLAPTNVSRATYARLFAAVGTLFGVGDGATTFGFPWCPADQTFLQGNGNLGTATIGALLAHIHSYSGTTGTENVAHVHGASADAIGDHQHTFTAIQPGGGAGLGSQGADPTAVRATDPAGGHGHSVSVGSESANHGHAYSGNTTSIGGAANLAAGIRATLIIKI